MNRHRRLTGLLGGLAGILIALPGLIPAPSALANCWNGAGSCVRTDGTRSGATVWQQARDAGVPIRAQDQDTHDQGLAEGIEATLNRNGENSIAADISWGSNRITSLAEGTTTADAVNVGQARNQAYIWTGTTTGTNAVIAGLTPSLAAYVEGQVFRLLKSGSANTSSSVTLEINGLAATPIKRQDGSDLAAGDLPADAVIEVLYDGTEFRLTSVAAGAASPQLSSVKSTSSGSSVTFTGIPAGVKWITVQLWGVSASQDSRNLIIQLGDSGGLETSGYVGIAASGGGSLGSMSNGFRLSQDSGQSNEWRGLVHLSLASASTNTWTESGMIASTAGTDRVGHSSGTKALTGTLDRLAITMSPSSTFDGGNVSITYQ